MKEKNTADNVSLFYFMFFFHFLFPFVFLSLFSFVFLLRLQSFFVLFFVAVVCFHEKKSSKLPVAGAEF
jgi:hypothetical protein